MAFRVHRAILLVILLLVAIHLYGLVDLSALASNLLPSGDVRNVQGKSVRFNGTWDSRRDSKNLLLSSSQCDQAFPSLKYQIDETLAMYKADGVKPVTSADLDQTWQHYQNGTYRAMIYDNELYIIDRYGARARKRGWATMHAIHRAIVTSPEALPNIEFVFTIRDQTDVDEPIWSYTRAPGDRKTFIMPDHGFWSWPGPKVGSYGEVRQTISLQGLERSGRWSEKVGKLVWRGNTLGLESREHLLQQTYGQEAWADVRTIDWRDQENSTAVRISMADHCRYKYAAHTEGFTYSGRLKYLQHCRSVILLPELNWPEYQHHLFTTSGPEQNVVMVKEDWSDLQEKIRWLIEKDGDAERIAQNSLEVFGQRYLTPAAETCYWRSLFRAWRLVSFEADLGLDPDDPEERRGVPFESFALERELQWTAY